MEHLPYSTFCTSSTSSHTTHIVTFYFTLTFFLAQLIYKRKLTYIQLTLWHCFLLPNLPVLQGSKSRYKRYCSFQVCYFVPLSLEPQDQRRGSERASTRSCAIRIRTYTCSECSSSRDQST